MQVLAQASFKFAPGPPAVGRGKYEEIRMAEQKRKKLDEIIAEYEAIKESIKELKSEASKIKDDLAERRTDIDSKIAELMQNKNVLDAAVGKCEQNNQAALAVAKASLDTKILEIDTFSKKIAADYDVSKTTKAQADANFAAITKASGQIEQLLTSSVTASEKTKQLSTISESVEERIVKYENGLNQMDTKYQQLVATIEGLLPDATSAGLATAFSNQKDTYRKSIRLWTGLRFVAVGGILIYGIFVYRDLSAVMTQIKEDGFWELTLTAFVWLVNKSPILLSLILFEEFSRRTYNRLFKLQEDYAYKQVVSQSFEGYKKQFLELGQNQSTNTALNDLCQNTVKSIAESPLRLVNEEKDSGGRRWYQLFRRGHTNQDLPLKE